MTQRQHIAAGVALGLLVGAVGATVWQQRHELSKRVPDDVRDKFSQFAKGVEGWALTPRGGRASSVD